MLPLCSLLACSEIQLLLYKLCFMIISIAEPDKVCVKFSFLTETLIFLRYDGDRKSERVMALSHGKKAAAQAVLLVVGAVMLCFGVWRGEAATVLSKAVKLCLECVGIG